ncbi:MAG: DNA replication and repair protein RecF [Lentisphaeria bacterium]|nr:DNA replication and repair protein RecF [Lentisphaeria bacterium]
MIIESLKLENFRNISRSELQFDSDAVFFEGGNGQGKTSLLEAVFYVANLRSFRTVKINELKKLGSPSFHLSLLFRKMQGWKSLLEVDCGLVRTLQSDRVPVGKASDFTGKIKTVAFLPDDPLIISGPSPLRRRFFDMFISLLDRSYFMDLQNYLQALRSRNMLLKTHNCNLDILRSYSTVLASSGSEIVRKREKYVELIARLMKQLFEELYPSLSDFIIQMDFTKETADPDSYLKKAENDLKRDLQRGFTTFGPHLDDFEFMFDGKPMRSFGSRGQCRMTSLILKLAELDAVREVNGALNDTVVLVDDATADLDLHARQAFLEKIRTAGQVFFAFTEIPPEFRLEKCDRFQVKAGEVARSN